MTSYQFYPRYSYITGITLGVETVVQFDVDHDFTDGEIVSLRVSRPYGTVELNNVSARVLSHTDMTVTLELNSQNLTPFVYPASGLNTPPVIVPSCSGIVTGQYVPTMNLEDAFDNRRT